jgi:hypothetical protein
MQIRISASLTLPARWPLRTQEPVRCAQIRVLLNTIVTDALAVWRRAPRRTWSDIGRLVHKQLRTLDQLYPEAGILEAEARAVALQFFAANVDPGIRSFVHRDGDPLPEAVVRLSSALSDARRQ